MFRRTAQHRRRMLLRLVAKSMLRPPVAKSMLRPLVVQNALPRRNGTFATPAGIPTRLTCTPEMTNGLATPPRTIHDSTWIIRLNTGVFPAVSGRGTCGI